MTLIIGKRSNLSKELFKKIELCVLISSDDIENNIDILLKYSQENPVNIVLNNFQVSTQLNDTKDFNNYIVKSILNTSRVLTYLIDNNININKVIYTSSSSVYGNNKFCSEDDQVKPMNLQGSLKVSNEELVRKICTTHHINFTIVRLFNMYGGDDNFSIFSKIKKAYLNNEVLNIINDGISVRDYIHIDDVVRVYLKLIEGKSDTPHILNIASGNGKKLVDILHTLDNNGINIGIKNIQRDEISASIADITELVKVIKIETFKDINNVLLHELGSI
ncbi:MAG: NAD-dependent epimerase/dehydratase family protein [Campylobacterota bacterium]|nr:NAD-dependent epimerase/dehydratase family protein [Campylobacterota bacterium]